MVQSGESGSLFITGMFSLQHATSCCLLLCVILQYEMLTGSLPFQGENRKATMTQILK